MIKMYGIPNCDSVKKATVWLNKNKKTFTFHDYKKEGIAVAKLKEWCILKNWELILNKRSSTWKKVMSAHDEIINNQAKAIHIMQLHTSIIKRPVIEINGEIIVGFDENLYIEKILK